MFTKVNPRRKLTLVEISEMRKTFRAMLTLHGTASNLDFLTYFGQAQLPPAMVRSIDTCRQVYRHRSKKRDFLSTHENFFLKL